MKAIWLPSCDKGMTKHGTSNIVLFTFVLIWKLQRSLTSMLLWEDTNYILQVYKSTFYSRMSILVCYSLNVEQNIHIFWINTLHYISQFAMQGYIIMSQETIWARLSISSTECKECLLDAMAKMFIRIYLLQMWCQVLIQ